MKFNLRNSSSSSSRGGNTNGSNGSRTKTATNKSNNNNENNNPFFSLSNQSTAASYSGGPKGGGGYVGAISTHKKLPSTTATASLVGSQKTSSPVSTASGGIGLGSSSSDAQQQQDELEGHLLRRLLQLKAEKEHLKNELVKSEGRVAEYQSEYHQVAQKHQQSVQECYMKLEEIFTSLVGVPLSHVQPDNAESIRQQIQDFVETFANRFTSPDVDDLQKLLAQQEQTQQQLDFYKKQLEEERDKTAKYQSQLVDVTKQLEAYQAKLESQSKELASLKYGGATADVKSMDISQQELAEILLKLDITATSKNSISPQERIKIQKYVREKVDTLATLKSMGKLPPMKKGSDLSHKSDGELAEELIRMQSQLAALKHQSIVQTRELERKKQNEKKQQQQKSRESNDFEMEVTNALLELRTQFDRIKSLSSTQDGDASKNSGIPEHLRQHVKNKDNGVELESLRAQVGQLTKQNQVETDELRSNLQKYKEFYQVELLASQEREQAQAEQVKKLRLEVAKARKKEADDGKARDSKYEEIEKLNKELQTRSEEEKQKSEAFELEVTHMLRDMSEQFKRLKSMAAATAKNASAEVEYEEASKQQRRRSSHSLQAEPQEQLERERKARQEIEEMMTNELFDLRAQIESLKEKNVSQSHKFQEELESTRKSFESELLDNKTRERTLATEIERLEQELRVRDDAKEMESNPIEAQAFLKETTETLRLLSTQMEKLKEDAAAHGIKPKTDDDKTTAAVDHRHTIEARLMASRDREQVLELELSVLKKKVNELAQKALAAEDQSSDGEQSDSGSAQDVEETKSQGDSGGGRRESFERRRSSGTSQHHVAKIAQKTLQIEALQKQLTKSRKFFREQLDAAKQREDKLAKQVEDLQARLKAKDEALSINTPNKKDGQDLVGGLSSPVSHSTDSPSSSESYNPAGRSKKHKRSWWRNLFGGSSSTPSKQHPRHGSSPKVEIRQVQQNEEMTYIGSR